MLSLIHISACGGGSKSPKSEVAEISAELEQQMNADDKAAIKEAQAELKEEGRSNTKAEPETETEEEFDPLQVDISVSGINPYEQELFEIFGLDNNFPKPKDSFEPVSYTHLFFLQSRSTCWKVTRLF